MPAKVNQPVKTAGKKKVPCDHFDEMDDDDHLLHDVTNTAETKALLAEADSVLHQSGTLEDGKDFCTELRAHVAVLNGLLQDFATLKPGISNKLVTQVVTMRSKLRHSLANLQDLLMSCIQEQPIAEENPQRVDKLARYQKLADSLVQINQKVSQQRVKMAKAEAESTKRKKLLQVDLTAFRTIKAHIEGESGMALADFAKIHMPTYKFLDPVCGGLLVGTEQAPTGNAGAAGQVATNSHEDTPRSRPLLAHKRNQQDRGTLKHKSTTVLNDFPINPNSDILQ